MSKELEALRELGMQTVCDEEGYETPVEVYLKEHYYTLMKLLLPPTADEVCEVLSEYLGQTIIFNSGSFMNERETAEVCAIGNLGLVYFNEHLPPHIVTLIGRFYEGVEE